MECALKARAAAEATLAREVEEAKEAAKEASEARKAAKAAWEAKKAAEAEIEAAKQAAELAKAEAAAVAAAAAAAAATVATTATAATTAAAVDAATSVVAEAGSSVRGVAIDRAAARTAAADTDAGAAADTVPAAHRGPAVPPPPPPGSAASVVAEQLDENVAVAAAEDTGLGENHPPLSESAGLSSPALSPVRSKARTVPRTPDRSATPQGLAPSPARTPVPKAKPQKRKKTVSFLSPVSGNKYYARAPLGEMAAGRAPVPSQQPVVIGRGAAFSRVAKSQIPVVDTKRPGTPLKPARTALAPDAAAPDRAVSAMPPLPPPVTAPAEEALPSNSGNVTERAPRSSILATPVKRVQAKGKAKGLG